MPRILKAADRSKHVSVCLTHTFDYIQTNFFDLMIGLETKYALSIKRSNVLPIDYNRTQLTLLALKDPSVTHLLYLDTDIIPPRKDFIDVMISYDLPIVGLMCTKKTPPYEPILVKDDAPEEEKLNNFWVQPKEELVEVDYTGTGCLMVKREVFSKMSPPFFQFMCSYDTEEGHFNSGEDIYFLTKAKSYGYKVYVDTKHACTHVGNYGFGIADFHRHKWEEKCKEHNDKAEEVRNEARSKQ